MSPRPNRPVPTDRAVPARVGNMRNAALRAVDDPVVLARAARIVRAALVRKALTHDDLDLEIVHPSDLTVGKLHGRSAPMLDAL